MSPPIPAPDVFPNKSPVPAEQSGSNRPKLGVYKFASCDGCQLALLSVENHLRQLADSVEICYFLEASSRIVPGPYDIGIVEGSVTTAHDAERIRGIRRDCRYLIAIGACATAGGIQALRNWANVEEYLSYVYAEPQYIDTLATSTAISEHVPVDFELRGCPIEPQQLLRVISDLLVDRQPRLARHSVCVECKLRQNVCVAVARGIPCLGPITQAGCGAICPSFDRECFGCFGPQENINAASWIGHCRSTDHATSRLVQLLRNVNSYDSHFREAGDGLIAKSISVEPS